jgi:hypothetical protein
MSRTPEQQRDDDVRAVLSTIEGRRFLWRLLEAGGLWGPSYAETATATAYNEGRRSVAINLMLELQRVAPERYLQALREHQEAVELALKKPPEEPQSEE